MAGTTGVARRGSTHAELLKLLSDLDELISESDGLIRDLYRADPVVQRLASIPGIGKFLSVLIRFEIDDIERFKDQSNLLAYAGLVPTTSSSGGKTRHGKLIKSSNHWLRWGLFEAVWPAITADHWLRSIYDRNKKRKHTNIAKSVVAKKLLTLVYKVWKEERNYLPVQPLRALPSVGQP
ncbi:MAG: transposase [Calditrichota bacterium]